MRTAVCEAEATAVDVGAHAAFCTVTSYLAERAVAPEVPLESALQFPSPLRAPSCVAPAESL